MKTLAFPPYHVLLMVEPAEVQHPDSNAWVKAVDGRHVACIYLHSEWMDLSYDHRREYITHEILHLVHRHVDDVITNEVAYEVTADAYARIDRSYHLQLEYMVDHLAFFMSETHQMKEGWDECHGRKPAERPTDVPV